MAKISIIGGGVMGKALSQALSSDGHAVIVADPDQAKLASFKKPIQVTSRVPEAIDFAEVIILAVKPQDLEKLFAEIKHLDLQEKTVISIAAGFPIEKIKKGLKVKSIVRAMPNTPAVLAASATAFFANSEVKDTAFIVEILSAFGLAIEVDSEDELDIATSIAGSGPAYFFLLFDALTKAGQDLGLDQEKIKKLVLQTAVGSAELAQNSDESFSELKQKVTSKQGTTEAALTSFSKNKFTEIVGEAVQSAYQRAKELGG